jgi:HAD superfamily hydrolase (TIGR01509 family)
MESSGLFPYLDIIISSGDVKNSKPNPEMYLKAINYFGFTAEECLILEDNENGIRAAKASGAHLLVVRDVHEVNLQNILSAVKDIENVN